MSGSTSDYKLIPTVDESNTLLGNFALLYRKVKENVLCDILYGKNKSKFKGYPVL